VGFLTGELHVVGFLAGGLRAEFFAGPIRPVGFDDDDCAGSLGRDARAGQFRTAELLGCEVRVADIRAADGFLGDLHSGRFHVGGLHAADFRVADLHAPGLYVVDFHVAGFHIARVYVIDFHIADLLADGILAGEAQVARLRVDASGTLREVIVAFCILGRRK
jgi:hypothetical protein